MDTVRSLSLGISAHQKLDLLASLVHLLGYESVAVFGDCFDGERGRGSTSLLLLLFVWLLAACIRARPAGSVTIIWNELFRRPLFCIGYNGHHGAPRRHARWPTQAPEAYRPNATQ